MRLPSLSRDHWQLVSGEARHAESPDTFEIPSSAERASLRPGLAVKLIFEIEREAAGATVERMWVTVTQCNGDGYLGVLENQPRSIATDEDCYLGKGCEVPFLPMHVIAIGIPPAEYVAERLETPPARRWFDDEGLKAS